MSLFAAASSTNVQVSKLGDTSPLAKSMMHIDCKIGKQRREKLILKEQMRGKMVKSLGIR